MEGGAFQSKSLARASVNDYVFVFLHQTRADSVKSYKLFTEEYLEEEFLHPAYFYFRPDGTEYDKAERGHHMALTAQHIDKVLKQIAKEWGRGLGKKAYGEALATLEAAEKQMAAEETTAARAGLDRVSRLKARCGVKDRAVAMLRLMDAQIELLAAWRAIEDLPEQAKTGIEKALLGLDPVSALRLLRRERLELPAALAFEEQLTGFLRQTIRLDPVKLDKIYLKTGTLYCLKALFATDLPDFDGLVLQISYRTDRDKTLEGFATFNRVRPYRRHRAAVCLSARDLHYAEVANARVQLFVGDVLLAESLLAKSPADFPLEDSHVVFGPDLLKSSESLSAGARADLRLYKIGRYVPKR